MFQRAESGVLRPTCDNANSVGSKRSRRSCLCERICADLPSGLRPRRRLPVGALRRRGCDARRSCDAPASRRCPCTAGVESGSGCSPRSPAWPWRSTRDGSSWRVSRRDVGDACARRGRDERECRGLHVRAMVEKPSTASRRALRPLGGMTRSGCLLPRSHALPSCRPLAPFWVRAPLSPLRGLSLVACGSDRRPVGPAVGPTRCGDGITGRRLSRRRPSVDSSRATSRPGSPRRHLPPSRSRAGLLPRHPPAARRGRC